MDKLTKWKQARAVLLGSTAGAFVGLLAMTGTAEQKIERLAYLALAGFFVALCKLMVRILAMIRQAPRATMRLVEKVFPPSFRAFRLEEDSYRYWERSKPSPLLRCPWAGSR